MNYVVMPQSYRQGTLLPSLFIVLLTKSTTAQSKNRLMNGKEAVILKFNFMSKYVEIKCQLDATDEFLLQILLLAQHVSGTIMPIIRSSEYYASGCCLSHLVLAFQVVGMVWS